MGSDMALKTGKGSRQSFPERVVAWYWDLDWNLIFSSRRERKEIKDWQRFWDLVWAENLGTHPGDDDLPRYFRHRDHPHWMRDGRAERHVMFTLSVNTKRTPEELAAAVDRMELGIDEPPTFEFEPPDDRRAGPAVRLLVKVLDTSPGP